MKLRRREFIQAAARGAAAIAGLEALPAVDALARAPEVASTPPMGWNSWDCFGASVREDEVRANADYMAANLRRHGWEYVVVDIQWYEPTASGSNYHPNARLEMDQHGRLMPAPNRFPSASGGQGFRPLAHYCHRKGLKFGIHVMRGIPRQAVAAHTPVLGSSLTAANVADTRSTCPWNTDMYGVDTTRPETQAWYDSVLRLYADWGVDYIKVDDLSAPYHTGEIEQIRTAIDRCGRPIVFSTSPGETPLSDADHIRTHANMWRISGDFWDRWGALRHAFDLIAEWNRYAGPGHWPDADMLPLGHIRLRSTENGSEQRTKFTPDEQRTLMTLWCIARSPLMFGGHLPDTDPFTLRLLTDPDLLRMHRHGAAFGERLRGNDRRVWVTRTPGADYAALFNLAGEPAAVEAPFVAIGLPDASHAYEVWTGERAGPFNGVLSTTVPAHGARLLRIRRA